MTATYNARPGAPAGTVAKARFVRMSATKVRAVLDLIRGVEVRKAEEILRFSERDAALVVGKLLRSAVANAENNFQLDPDDLYVAAVYADDGPSFKRMRPASRGRGHRYVKRTSHLTVVVDERRSE